MTKSLNKKFFQVYKVNLGLLLKFGFNKKIIAMIEIEIDNKNNA